MLITEMGFNMLTTLIIIFLVLAFFGALPNWGHSQNWGYAPSSGLGLVLVVLVVLWATGRI
jgi:hypothetical protein